MAKREKTTQAKIYPARLNPTTSQYDAEAIRIIEDLKTQGYNFKQIAVDAILYSQGRTPDMFDRGGFTLNDMRTLLENFAANLLTEISNRGIGPSVIVDDDDDAGQTKFVSKFAKSFLDRQRKGES